MADAGDLSGRLRKVRGGGTPTPAPASRGKVETTKASVYFDDDDWAQMRRDAFEAAVPLNSLVVAAVKLYLAADAATKATAVETARQVTRDRRGIT